MVALFRRFRRGKATDKSEPDEASEIVEEPLADKPVASEKPAEPAPAVEPMAPVEIPGRLPPVATASPRPPSTTSARARTPTATAAPAVADHGAPPPLPEPDVEGGQPPPRSRLQSSRCFLCGTEMDGPWCPKCRMAWND
jgi:hypothetical protein